MKQYECNHCGACWAAKNDKQCLDCLSKDIKVIWDPNKRK